MRRMDEAPIRIWSGNSRGWDAQDERAFTWVELEDLAVKKGRDQRRLLFINTHLGYNHIRRPLL